MTEPTADVHTDSDELRKARWLEARRTALTGTDAGKILAGRGLEVWLEKKGLAAPVIEADLPDFVRAGNYYERGTLAWYADQEQAPLEFADSYRFVRHPNPALPIGCTFDAVRMDSGIPVDAKMVHRWTPYDAAAGTGWGESGSALVPTYYAAQLMIQTAVLDASAAHLAAFFRVDGEFAVFRLERDAEREARLLTFLTGWWKRYIVGNEQPAAGGSEAVADYLKMVPRLNQTIRKATPEEDALGEAYALARDAAKMAELRKEELKNRMRQITGGDLGVIGSGWKFTHKENRPQRVRDDEKVIAFLLAELTKVVGPVHAARVHGEALDRATTMKSGARVARFTDLKAAQE